MKKNILFPLAIVSMAFFSCSSTPQKRIAKFPDKFSTLTADDQSLVEQGRIQQGMTKDAVYLAIGKPEQITYGANKSGEYEQWNYNTLTPVVTNNVSIGVGWGGGPWGWGGVGRRGLGRGFGGWGNGFGGWGLGPNIAYVPTRGATVKFTGDSVDEYKFAGRR